MKVLLSIKPEFASKIFDGSKKYEYRRVIFKNPGVKKVVVYASSPVKKVIGEFEIEYVIKDDLVALWDTTQVGSGITLDYFLQYFTDCKAGFAIKIKNTTLYRSPKCIKRDFNVLPPQSFVYLA